MLILLSVLLALFVLLSGTLFFLYLRKNRYANQCRAYSRRTAGLLLSVDAEDLSLRESSDAFLEIVGLSSKGLREHRLQEIIHPDDMDFLNRSLVSLNGKSSDELERIHFDHLQIRLKTAHFGWQWFETSFFPIRDGARIILCGCFVFKDDLMRTRKMLMDCQFQQEILFRNSFDIVWTMNCASRKLVLLTDILYKQLGIDDHKAGTVESNEAVFVHDDLIAFRGMVNRRLEALSKSGLTIDEPQNFPVRVRNGDGSLAWLMTRSTLQKNEIGEFNLYGVARRISAVATPKSGYGDDFFDITIALPNVCAFWMDAEMRFLGCNDCFAIDMGYKSPSDIVGKKSEDLSQNETWSAFRKDLDDAFAFRLPISQKIVVYRTSGGSGAFAVYNVIPLDNEDGSLKRMLGVYVIVTEEIVQKYLKSEKDIPRD